MTLIKDIFLYKNVKEAEWQILFNYFDIDQGYGIDMEWHYNVSKEVTSNLKVFDFKKKKWIKIKL